MASTRRKPAKIKAKAKAPKGCICDRSTWGRIETSACDEFVLNRAQGYCLNCAHDKACHSAK